MEISVSGGLAGPEDAALIGGAVVRIGSTIYNGSVQAQLERLRVRLAAQ